MYDTFDATVTVYNLKKESDATRDTWVKTVFKPNENGYSGVSWYGKTKVAIGESGLIGADEYRIRFMVDIMKDYVSPEIWNAALTADELTGKWTIQNGDRIRKGESQESDPAVFNIDSAQVIAVHDNRRGMPSMQHIAVEGK